MDIITKPLGWILNLCNILVGNYGLAIILFTVLIKMALLPLTVKQQRSMMKTQRIQPLMNEIQQKYANDKEKQQMEMMKLYQKYKINPMSGCLPLLIQLPILMALYWGVPKDEFWRILNAIKEWGEVNPDAVSQFLASINMDSLDKLAENGYKMFGLYEIQIARLLETHPQIMANHWITGGGKVYEVINFGFLGMDLSQTPSLNALIGMLFGNAKGLTTDMMILWLIPIFSGLSSFVSMKFAQAMQPQQAPQKDANGEEKPNPMKSMNLFMPFISAWFAFTLPAAIGLYWVVSNLLQMAQQVILNKVIKIDVTEEQIEGEIVNVKKNRKKRKK